MAFTLRRCLAGLLCLASVGAIAQNVVPRHFSLFGHGQLELAVPSTWSTDLRRAPGRLPPTLEIRQQAGAPFEILITVIWPMRQEIPLPDLPTLHEEVASAAKTAQSQAIDTRIVVRDLVGPTVRGYYFSATDRAPKEGEYKYMTQGAARVGRINLAFTILTNDGQESVVKAALKMLREATHLAVTSKALRSSTGQPLYT